MWGQAAKNIGQLAKYAGRKGAAGLIGAAIGTRGTTAAGAFYGGLAGGMYGAASNDTSILGGMAMGAGMGAGAGRYGRAGLRRGKLGKRGIGTSVPGMRGAAQGFGRGVRTQAQMDYRGSMIIANKAKNRLRSSLKGIF